MNSKFLTITGKSAILAMVIFLMAQIPLAAQEKVEPDTQDTAAAERNILRFWNPRNIEGTWNAQVTIRVCATGAPIVTFQAMSVYARGGTYHDTNATNPALRSSGFGTWEHRGGNRYSFAFRFFRFDASGANIGSTVVRHTVTLDLSANAGSSAGSADFLDPAGNLVMAGCSTATATRFF